jgi:cytochrome P450
MPKACLLVAKGLAPAIQALSHFAFTSLFMPFKPPMWLPLPSVRTAKSAIATLNAYLTTHIARHHNTVPHPSHSSDLLGMMRAARDPENPEYGFSAQELHDQAMVMFLAGHETTAATMTWWCGLMARHPDVSGRIQDEVNKVLQGQAPTPEAIAHMPWLQASIKESLRLYPPALLMTRRALTDLQAGPYTVRKGELLAITPYAVHRDPRWYDSPNEFKPERFLPGAPEIPRGAWIPFGTGPRVCMGQHFAMLEMAIAAAMLLQRYKFVWPTDTAWPKAKMTISLRPETGMKLMLVPRH